MSIVTAILIIVAASLAACLCGILVHHRLEMDARRRHHDIGVAIFLQFGVIFAVLLAFVFSEAWSEYNNASQAIDLENGALHGAAMIATSLPPPERMAVLDAETQYLRSVIDHEWPKMAQSRGEDLKTDQRLAHIIRIVAAIRSDDAATMQSRVEMLALLQEAHSQREVRIFQLRNGMPRMLWVLLIGFTVVLIGFVTLAGVEYRLVMALLCASFTAAIVGILVMIQLLDYPFEGGLALPPTDFQTTLQKIELLKGS